MEYMCIYNNIIITILYICTYTYARSINGRDIQLGCPGIRWISSRRVLQNPSEFHSPSQHAGWWLSHPSEKYESQLELLFPIYGKTKKCFKPPANMCLPHIPLFEPLNGPMMRPCLNHPKKGRISELHPPPQVEMTQINLGECQQVLNWKYITNPILLTLNTSRNYG